MSMLYVLIPLALVLLAVAAWALIWAIRSGQFDDLESHGWSVVLDDDQRPPSDPDSQPSPDPAVGGRPCGRNRTRIRSSPDRGDKTPHNNDGNRIHEPSTPPSGLLPSWPACSAAATASACAAASQAAWERLPGPTTAQ